MSEKENEFTYFNLFDRLKIIPDWVEKGIEESIVSQFTLFAIHIMKTQLKYCPSKNCYSVSPLGFFDFTGKSGKSYHLVYELAKQERELDCKTIDDITFEMLEEMQHKISSRLFSICYNNYQNEVL